MNVGKTLHLDDLVDGYVDVVDAVMAEGQEASPRGLLTKELLAVTIVVDATAPMLPLGTGRKVSSKLAAVEALQVIGGYSDAVALVKVNQHLADFADQGAFHGAYGPRLRPQIETALRRLREDPETRRAVVTLWDPLRDSVEGMSNYPCTTELQFTIRNRMLNLHVTMRANDAWHGFAYDAFVFNQLQWTVANVLGVEPGMYIHHAASLHLYEEHWALTDRLEYADARPYLPAGLASPEVARALAEKPHLAALLGGDAGAGDPSIEWYAERVA